MQWHDAGNEATGWDGYVGRYELTAPLTDAERDDALAVIADDLRPTDEATLAGELGRLRVVTISRELMQDDLEVTVAIYTDELARRGYPRDVVLEVLRGWNSKFWPALVELTESMDRLTLPRRRLAEALARPFKQRGTE